MTTVHDVHTPSALAANKALAVRWLDLIAAGDVAELCQTAAPTWTMLGGPPNLPTGPDGVRQLGARVLPPAPPAWSARPSMP
jgi:hypothetical protein